MNKEIQEYEYSDEETLKKAIECIKKGSTEKNIQLKFNLTNDDLDLIDFVINEF